MKIAMVIERMIPAAGGRERSVAEIARMIAQQGHEVTILCAQGAWPDQQVQVRSLGQRGKTNFLKRRNFVRDVEKQIAKRRYDIVHTTLPVSGANVYQLRSGTVRGQFDAKRRMYDARGKRFRSATIEFSLSRMQRDRMEENLIDDPRCTCFPVSDMIAEELSTFYGRTRGVRKIFNAVDLPDPPQSVKSQWRDTLRKRLDIPADATLALCMAKNFELKGVRETLEAFALFRHEHPEGENAYLVAAGADKTSAYRRLARKLKIVDRVRFPGSVTNTVHWYATADICILLSWYDPCSRVVLEAVRCNVPAITTRLNGACEVLEDGAGIVVDQPDDVHDAANALGELCDANRRRESQDAMERISSWLGMERHVDELLQAYMEIANKND